MIIRSIRTQKYSVIPNLLIDDKNLDWKELGLLVYLLSKPDEWEVSVKHLQKQRKAGRDAILNMLKALRNAGYVVMKNRHEGGVDYVVYDTPQKRETPQPENTEVEEENNEPLTEKPLTDNPEAGKPTNGKSGYIVNTEDKTNTEKEEVKTETQESDSKVAARRIANHLHKKLTEEIPEASTVKPESWITEIERAIRLDGRTEEQLINIIDWIYSAGTFWIPNVQSGAKLRKNYITMVAQSRRPSQDRKPANDFNNTDYSEGTEGFITHG